ncbi:uncharacterized protein PHACADRAFT_262570 [Phanerochaete carnosa HHB-10118-sp]|uniref:Uncharacterized protein n=1 Tax=Phanerochaete carnosa (strain HHB-10118-sp) TaxID=650164 RepID=K5WP41_PHACS|nr:uncharacterized protein PHACADRAFT_262570 [Phanerochaete carnosa HHB-10118-sp]EKM52102.1 hypothetical protein PHACADRAFT_262570 [Phanerochaete carnosa HHB-10118-sp]
MDHLDPNSHDSPAAYGFTVDNHLLPALPQETTPIAVPGPTEKISISTVFHPTLDAGTGPPDIKFIAADNVSFFAHIPHILNRSVNQFNDLIPTSYNAQEGDAPFVVAVPEPSPVFNIILHIIYGWSSAAFTHTLDDIAATVIALKTYGMSTSACLAQHTPLYTLMLAHASLRPLEIYALAAEHGLEHIAVVVSSQLVAYRLHEITDPLLVRMGARYLLRLAKLQATLMEKLRDLMLTPPEGHASTSTCGFAQQRILMGAWAIATASLSWKAKPDLSASVIQAAFNEAEGSLTCALCRDALRTRIRLILYRWTLALRTI